MAAQRSKLGPTFHHFPLISKASQSCLPNAVLDRRKDGTCSEPTLPVHESCCGGVGGVDERGRKENSSSHFASSSSLRSTVLQATEHISKGSQIYVSYLPPSSGSLPYQNRQHFLKFPMLHSSTSSCFCSSCQLPPLERHATDEKRSLLFDDINAILGDQQTSGTGRQEGPRFVAETVERIASLVETIVDEQPYLYFFIFELAHKAAQLLFTERDYVRALEWAWFSRSWRGFRDQRTSLRSTFSERQVGLLRLFLYQSVLLSLIWTLEVLLFCSDTD